MSVSVSLIKDFFLIKTPRLTHLDEYLQIAQMVYIAKTGNKLFPEAIYAIKQGISIPAIDAACKNGIGNDLLEIPYEIERFLTQITALLKNASDEEIIAISQEDVAFREAHEALQASSLDNHIEINFLNHAEEYKEFYADAIKLMNGWT